MCNPVEAFTGPSTNSQSHAAAKANRQQQSAIDYGMQQLNAIYNGGTYPIYSQSGGTFDPSQTYYRNTPTGYQVYTPPKKRKDGSVVDPVNVSGFGGDPVGMGLLGASFFGLGGGGPPSPQSLIKRGKLFSMTPSQNFQGYNDNFFNNRARAYADYALPQLGGQYQQTKNALLYNLANRGMSRSSVANQEMNDLNLAMGQQKQQIADTGQQYAQQLRSDVENSRQQAISQLYQTASPANAQQSALAAANQFTTPSAFAPLANGFANLVNQYAMQQQIAGMQQQGSYGGGSPYGYTSPLLGALPQNRT